MKSIKLISHVPNQMAVVGTTDSGAECLLGYVLDYRTVNPQLKLSNTLGLHDLAMLLNTASVALPSYREQAVKSGQSLSREADLNIALEEKSKELEAAMAVITDLRSKVATV